MVKILADTREGKLNSVRLVTGAAYGVSANVPQAKASHRANAKSLCMRRIQGNMARIMAAEMDEEFIPFSP
jgi:hypothetical protein